MRIVISRAGWEPVKEKYPFLNTAKDETIEVSSLEDLLGLIKKTGHSLVVSNYENIPMITIYDDYME